MLSSDAPCLIGRLGGYELSAVLTHLARNTPNPLRKLSYCRHGGFLTWGNLIRKRMFANTGLFPVNDTQLLSRFAALALSVAPQIDIIGSCCPGEKLLPLRARRVPLPDLEPYRHQHPWTSALAGKTVLVVHPFSDTIEQQYRTNRTLLFRDPEVLPEFRLRTIKAVQSLGCHPPGFTDWFDALHAMENAIDATDFDIAIIGAGAYGLPLAAHVKQRNRKAIQLGGATQILFGIRGKRWDQRPFFRALFNEHWIRPSADETPAAAHRVEGGCYW